MSRYPHTLYVAENSTDTVQNQDGNWEPTAAPYAVVSECREEPNGSGRMVILADGKAFQYSSIIYLPDFDSDLNSEFTVKVVDETGNTRIEGKVARVVKDRKNCRIWV